MNEFWNQFQGRTVGESYVLGQIIECNEESAVYLTDLPEGFPAVTKIRHGGPGQDHRRLESWVAAAELSHPNLIHVYGAGTTTLCGHPIDYIAMERADETLASVLAQRALSETEAWETFSPALAALSYLHHCHFVHGSLHPSNVMAVGETLKLSSDNILPVGESPGSRPNNPYDCPERQVSPASPKWDSWSFGALLVGSLTLRVPQVQEGEIEIPELHTPFSDVARHALVADPEQRWSIGRIVMALEGGGANGVASTLNSAFTEPLVEEAPEYSVPMLPKRAGLSPDFVSEPTRPRPKWFVPAAIFGILFLLLLVWLGRKPRNSTNAQVVSPVNQTFTPTTPSVPAPRTTPAGSTPPAALPNPLQKTHPQGGWYVVVATYTRKIDAEKRARSLTARWPKFRARVFEPPVNDPHHLVIIGANLSQDDADALCKHARAAGLPHDVYIKKFLKSRSGETPTDIER